MIDKALTTIRENRPAAMAWSVGVLLAVIGTTVLVRMAPWSQAGQRSAADFSVEVKRAISGHSVKLETDERVNYAAIRAPYKDENAELHKKARERNAKLVDDERVRLRYDENKQDSKGRLTAYVFADGEFVNEVLVREGLAYVRLTPDSRRYADKLLAAQAEARREKRGVWAKTPDTTESRYPADPKYGNFHRPDCEETEKIRPDRLVVHETRNKALDSGFAPCSKCMP